MWLEEIWGNPGSARLQSLEIITVNVITNKIYF